MTNAVTDKITAIATNFAQQVSRAESQSSNLVTLDVADVKTLAEWAITQTAGAAGKPVAPPAHAPVPPHAKPDVDDDDPDVRTGGGRKK